MGRRGNPNLDAKQKAGPETGHDSPLFVDLRNSLVQ